MRHISKYIGLLVLFTLIGIGCKETKTVEIKTEKISFTKEGELQIFKADSTLIKLDIEIADNDYERQTGLMHRETMLDEQGMLFIQDEQKIQNFYMKNTQIALDLIYIDDAFKIVSFQENAKPYDESSLSSVVPAKYVLEVNAGLVQQWQLQIGDRISYSRN